MVCTRTLHSPWPLLWMVLLLLQIQPVWQYCSAWSLDGRNAVKLVSICGTQWTAKSRTQLCGSISRLWVVFATYTICWIMWLSAFSHLLTPFRHKAVAVCLAHPLQTQGSRSLSWHNCMSWSQGSQQFCRWCEPGTEVWCTLNCLLR